MKCLVKMKGKVKMKIPKQIKIGGKVYNVEITDRLNLGCVNYSAEIDYVNLVIRIVPTAKGKMEADFIHEMVHGIFDHLGYANHDEKKIDELANALYMVIQDNPEMFINKKLNSHATKNNGDAGESAGMPGA